MMPDPLTKLQHRWIAIEVTPVEVYRRQNGEISVIKDPDTETEIQIGCEICNASPDDGWATLCEGPSDEDMDMLG